MGLLNGIRSRHYWVLLLIGLLCISCSKPIRPNIVLVVVEDLYWGSLSCPMHPEQEASADKNAQTPHLAKLASQGMRFSSAYASSPVSEISLASIESGKSSAQLSQTPFAPSKDLTITKRLASRGYQVGDNITRRSRKPYFLQLNLPKTTPADLDQVIGDLIVEIETSASADFTYLIVTASSGAPAKASRVGELPLLSGGNSDQLLEASIRVPLIIRGPGIQPNSWCGQRVVGFDWLPTLNHLAGIKDPLPKDLQGGSILHLLTGDTSVVERPYEALVFQIPTQTAILMGDHKLIRSNHDSSIQIYDVHRDISEQKDQAKHVIEFGRRMLGRLDQYLKEQGMGAILR